MRLKKGYYYQLFFFFFERLFTSLMGYNQMLTIDYSEPIFVVSILLAINLQDLKKKKKFKSKFTGLNLILMHLRVSLVRLFEVALFEKVEFSKSA